MTDHGPAPEGEDDAYYQLMLDPEALLLCALMWAPSPDEGADRVCRVLEVGDFNNINYGAVYGAVVALRSAGRSADAASIRSWLLEQGTDSAIDQHVARQVLVSLSTLGTPPGTVVPYADQVLGVSYRRFFLRSAAALTHAGETAPEARLFELMVEHGRLQRRAWERRQSLRG